VARAPTTERSGAGAQHPLIPARAEHMRQFGTIFGQSLIMRSIQLTAHIERDPETGLYIGMVPSIPGAHSQAKSLDELQVNLKEVVELCFEEMSEEEIKALPEFVGLQSFSIAV